MGRFSYTATMDKLIPTTHLDVRAFARSGGSLAGRAPLSAFARVADDCHGSVDDVEVSWSARGELRRDQTAQAQVWLHLQAKTELPLTCQRCLDIALITLVVDQPFRFVADEEAVAEQDDEAVEDLLVLGADLNLLELIEDELVLAMPLIAHHEVCPTPPSLSVQDEGFDAPVDKPGPFAALAAIKSVKGKGPH
jgi:uncharacterized protein